MRFDFYSSRWSQLMLCAKQFRVKLAPGNERTKLEKARLTFFLLPRWQRSLLAPRWQTFVRQSW